MSARQTERKGDPEEGAVRGHDTKKLVDTDSILERLQRLERELQALKREVAGRFEPEPLPQGELGLLVCRVGSSLIGFLQDLVCEVVPVPRLTPLPEAPFWVPGLLNLRGSLVPVVDVQARVTGRPRRFELTDLVVVAEVEGRSVGFLVQEILDLRRAEGGRMIRPRDVPFAAYLMGAIQTDGAPVLVLSTVALARLSELPEAPAT